MVVISYALQLVSERIDDRSTCDSRQVFVVRALEIEGQGRQIVGPKIELLTNLSPRKFLRADSIIASTSIDDPVKLEKVDMFTANARLTIEGCPVMEDRSVRSALMADGVTVPSLFMKGRKMLHELLIFHCAIYRRLSRSTWRSHGTSRSWYSAP